MKKIIAFLLPAFVIMACNNAKQNENKTGDKKETVAETPASGKDTELINWLNGKMLTAEDPAKDYHNFKLHSDGTCEDKGGAKVSWTVENGKLDIGGLMKIGIEKKDETTIILHRSLSDETYKVGPIQ
jgi:hypothetical protein